MLVEGAVRVPDVLAESWTTSGTSVLTSRFFRINDNSELQEQEQMKISPLLFSQDANARRLGANKGFPNTTTSIIIVIKVSLVVRFPAPPVPLGKTLNPTLLPHRTELLEFNLSLFLFQFYFSGYVNPPQIGVELRQV